MPDQFGIKNMMHKQVFLEVPPDKAWRTWTQIEKRPEWVHGVRSSRLTGTVREGVGLSWEEVCLFGSQEAIMQNEVVEWTPLQKIKTQTALPMGASLQTVAEFRPHGNGTEVNVFVEWNLGILSMLLGEDKIREALEKAFEKTAENWKARAVS